jgi:hypothetical protein
MNTAVFVATVWVLVTSSLDSHGGGSVTYSPPLKDLASCEFLQKNLPNDNHHHRTRCVQINMAVTK